MESITTIVMLYVSFGDLLVFLYWCIDECQVRGKKISCVQQRFFMYQQIYVL